MADGYRPVPPGTDGFALSAARFCELADVGTRSMSDSVA